MPKNTKTFKVAAVQTSPVFLNKKATVEKACELVAKAASKNLSTLKSDKTKGLNAKLKEIGGEKKTKIKELNVAIKGLQKQINAMEKERARAAKLAAQE